VFEKLDGKATFIHGNLEETIYMQQPKNIIWFEIKFETMI